MTGSDAPLGALLRSLRKERDLTQAELAARLGYSVELVRSVEARGQRPSRELASRLAEWVGVPSERRHLFVQWARGALPAGESWHLQSWLGEFAVPTVPADVPTNLPGPRNLLIGREGEVAALTSLLRRPGVRLVTLRGAPGIGKTRLALQVATELSAAFPDGAFFVSLASVTDATLVLPAIAGVLTVAEASGELLVERLAGAIRRKRLLLVLDNFEHLLAAGPAIGQLLDAAPRLTVLVASREPLRVYGEHEVEVQPLARPALRPLPALPALRATAAVALFLERARSARADFDLDDENAAAVAELCVRLDGLPLAIELAAARVKDWSPAEMLERLPRRFELLVDGPRDAPARLRALRAAIDWSHDTLDADEQALLARLGVFVGGCSEAAVRAVCGRTEGHDVGTSDLLASLARRSFVRAVPPRGSASAEDEAGGRFELLETVRAYALERLEARGETASLRRRHAAHFLSLAERLAARVAPERMGSDLERCLDRLEQEHANVRAALAWAREIGDGETELRLASALGGFWELRGHWTEGRRWLEDALARATPSPTSARAAALLEAGKLAGRQCEYGRARALLHESLAIRRERGDGPGRAAVLRVLGHTAKAQGSVAEARACFEEGLAVAEDADDRRGRALFLEGLGYLAADEADYAVAGAHLEDSLAIWRELGDRWGIGNSLEILGYLAGYRGDYAACRACFEESLANRRVVGDPYRVALALHGLGRALMGQGDYPAARRRLEESLTALRELGNKRAVANALNSLGELALSKRNHRRAAALYEEALLALGEPGNWAVAESLHGLGLVACQHGDWRRATELFRRSLVLRHGENNRRGLAPSLVGLASVAVAAEHPERAARLLGAAHGILESLGAAMRPIDCAARDRAVAAARAHLTSMVFEAAWSGGRGLSVEQAVAFALESVAAAEPGIRASVGAEMVTAGDAAADA